MKSKITPDNFKIDILKGLLTVAIFTLSFIDLYAQNVVVQSVSPTRVTTQTEVTIVGVAGVTFTEETVVTCGDIYSDGPKTISPDGTQLTFIISRNNTSPVGNPIGNDVGLTPLQIGGEDVYVVGSDAQGNQVLLEYVAPSVKQYNSNADDFVVTEVFTTWDKNENGDNFWRSSSGGKPDDSHDLLGFTYGGTTYSTGVGDAKLTERNIGFEGAVFKAYSSNGVSGRPYNLTYLTMADRIDGVVGSAVMSPSIMATAYDVLIDGGENGLDLGTGISNFNQEANIRFYSGNGDALAINDVPDLLITQIADPGEGWSNDIYYYGDPDGNVVGRPISLQMINGTHFLFRWVVNLYRMNNVPFESSYPVGVESEWDANGTGERSFKMVAFKLHDFEVDATNLGGVNNINLMAGGTADLAFIAYNAATFNIKSPTIDLPPVSRYICNFSDGSFDRNIVFDVEASIDGIPNPPVDSDEEIKYQWYREFASIPGATENEYGLAPVATVADTIRFKVRVSNKFGAIDLPATLKEGGTPAYWNGSNWTFPSNYYNGTTLRFAIQPMDRNLIFSDNYSVDENLEGCDCYVPAGKTVTIPDGKTLKLYSNITVEGITDVFNENGVKIDEIPSGTFTLENNASLIQTKAVTTNENLGNIIVKRDAEDTRQYDYVYWSSPVEKGKLSMIPGATNHVYKWQVDAVNGNGTFGNWVVEPDGNMRNGRGYIKRVNSGETDINTIFEGIPNNGLINIPVFKTGALPVGITMDDAYVHLNLLGNPYPSAINAETFLVENVDLEGYVKVWSYNRGTLSSSEDDPFYGDFKYNYGDQYLTYNILGAVPEEPFIGMIASGQGFFVQVLDTANAVSEVSFNNGMRYDKNEDAYDNSGFYRSSVPAGEAVQAEKQLVWLSLVNENNISSVTLVGYAEGATDGKDRLYDAISGNGNMRIYSVLETSDLIIQGRALPFEDSDKVHLGVEILKNGIYKIGIDHLKGSLMLDENQGIYIEDTYNTIIHDLKKAPYSFTATVGDVKDRFVLRYTNSTLSTDDKQLSDTFVYIKNEQLYVKASKNIASVVVYDLTGKKLMDYKLDGRTDGFNAPFQFSKGAYLTVITLENVGSVTKKVMN